MRLIVQHRQGTAQARRLERGLLTIGRGQDCDLVLQDTQASRRHAELRRYGDQWLIVDLGSTNGTFVGGVRLRPDEARPLPPGIPVQIGDTQLVLDDHGSPRSGSPRSAAEWEGGQGSDSVIEGGGANVPEAQRSGAQRSGIAGDEPARAGAAWLARVVVAVGSTTLIVGSLLDWIRVEVSLPVLGRVMNQSYNGLDSEQAGLFIGVAVLALVLVLVDILARRRGSGLAAGAGQALAGAVAVVSVAVSVYRYYQIGTQQILGVSLVDVMTKYLSNQVHIFIQLGVYLVAIGLVALIVGGLLRLLIAAVHADPLRGTEA